MANKIKNYYVPNYSFSALNYIANEYDGHCIHENVDFVYKKEELEGFLTSNGTILESNYSNGKMQSAWFLYKHNLIYIYVPYEESKKPGIPNVGIVIYRSSLHTSVVSEFEPFKACLKKGSKVFFLMQNKNGFYTSDGETIDEPIDTSLLYNESFKDFSEDIVKKLSNSKAGLYMFSGVPGTGKTTFIKYLTQQVPEREFIYIPSAMASVLDDPSLLDTLQDHKNSILIVEDSEDLIKDRTKSRNANAVSTVLNITDGLIGASLGLSVILTYNCDDSEIDKALLRKGRLLAKYHFDLLNVETAKKLAEANNLKGEITQPMTLADVFNIEEDNGHVEKKQNKVGF
jgi:hypothetical protein